jgi:F0F1-type ATP synthase membrane subunit b/b'
MKKLPSIVALAFGLAIFPLLAQDHGTSAQPKKGAEQTEGVRTTQPTTPGEGAAHQPEGGEAAGHGVSTSTQAGTHGAAAGGASGEHGSGGGHAANPNEIWWKWANFGLLAVGIGYLIGKNAGPFFAARTQSIQQGIREAAAVKEAAEAKAADIERRVANLGQEIEALRAQSKQEIATEGARIRTETEQMLAKVQANADAEIASATKNAKQELRAYSAELAVELAAQQVARNMSPAAQDQLVSGFVQDLKGKASLN